MCDFDYEIPDKQKIAKRMIDEKDEVWENEPELEKMENENKPSKEQYIPLTQ
jgi:hypothetical protein